MNNRERVEASARDERCEGARPAESKVGDWRVSPALNEISRAGLVVHLEPKAIALLVYLAQRPGQVVSRDELLATLWPGVIVGDNTLTQAVIKLRRALGDTAREPTYIQAIAKRGYRLIAPVERSCEEAQRAAPAGPSPPAPSRWSVRQWTGAASIAALVLAVAVWVVLNAVDADPLSGLSSPVAARPGGLPTLIVRPFEALGEDSERLFARGLTADLMNDLSKVSGLWIVGGAEAEAATSGKGAPLEPAPGRYVLTGTIQFDGKRLRLFVALADLDAGRQLWSQRFDREARDLFSVQDELAQSILAQLPIKVSQAEKASLSRRYTRDVTAYEYFLRGQAAVQARRQAQNDLAREMYWKAIAIDPAFARAYAGLAMTYALAYQLGWADDAALGRALEFADTAVQMRPDLPEAHWVLGFVETQRRRHTEAIRHLERALRLSPSYADAYALLGGIMTYVGRPADGASLLRTALRLNPDAGSLYFLLLGRACYFLGDYEQARVNLDQALARNAENLEARAYLAAVLGQLGEPDAAAWQAEEIRAIEPNFNVQRWLATYPMTDRRQRQRLVLALRPLGL